MTNKQQQARTEYEAAFNKLVTLCDAKTHLTPLIMDKSYPIRVTFLPNLSLFGDENVDENGEVYSLTVEVGMSTVVKSTLRFKMDSKLLKKLVKLAEKVGNLYYHAFTEEQFELITPRRPFLKAEEGTDADVSGVLCCPECEHPVIISGDPNTKTCFCQVCGQAIDCTPEPEKEVTA